MNKRLFPLRQWSLLALGLMISAITLSSLSHPQSLVIKKPVLRHVVSFQFKEEISEARQKQATQDFLALEDRISEIVSFEGGTDVSVEDHAKGFTHCYILTFKDEAARDAYLIHPAHVEVANKNKPLMKDLFVIDVWGEK